MLTHQTRGLIKPSADKCPEYQISTFLIQAYYPATKSLLPTLAHALGQPTSQDARYQSSAPYNLIIMTTYTTEEGQRA